MKKRNWRVTTPRQFIVSILLVVAVVVVWNTVVFPPLYNNTSWGFMLDRVVDTFCIAVLAWKFLRGSWLSVQAFQITQVHPELSFFEVWGLPIETLARKNIDFRQSGLGELTIDDIRAGLGLK